MDLLTPSELRARGSLKWNVGLDHDVLALWVAEMDFPTAPVVRDAMRACVERDQVGYARHDEDTPVPRALAAFGARRYGWAIDPADVHLLPDVLRGVELAIRRFSPPGSPVVLPTPAYMPFFDVIASVERRRIDVPMVRTGDRWCLDLGGIDAALAGGPGTVVLCNPYNPLGTVFTREELAALAEVVERRGARVVSDEIHAPLTYGVPHVPYAAAGPHAAGHSMTMMSATKAWNLPGLKCAAAVTTNHADRERYAALPFVEVHGASTVGIEATGAAFDLGEPWLDDLLGQLDQNRRLLGTLLEEHLPQVGYRVPDGTFFGWLDCGDLALPGDPAAYFLEHARVLLSPGPPFGAGGDGFVRLNFATSPEILTEAVLRMAKAVPARLAR
jgi:cysteine-S-conjugate beta-lyase